MDRVVISAAPIGINTVRRVFSGVLLGQYRYIELANRADIEAVVVFEDVLEIRQRQRREVLS